MKQLSHPLVEPYLGWPVVLDSNLLLLHWSASFDPTLITGFKRFSEFERVDMYILEELLQALGQLRTTPHVLTEVSNLANNLPSWRKAGWAAHTLRSVAPIPEFHEAAAAILSNPLWAVFGLTDAALCRLASDHVIVSIDGRLVSYLQAHGLAAINFKHLRRAPIPL